jgi:hypothetical protein
MQTGFPMYGGQLYGTNYPSGPPSMPGHFGSQYGTHMPYLSCMPSADQQRMESQSIPQGMPNQNLGPGPTTSSAEDRGDCTTLLRLTVTNVVTTKRLRSWRRSATTLLRRYYDAMLSVVDVRSGDVRSGDVRSGDVRSGVVVAMSVVAMSVVAMSVVAMSVVAS